MIGSSLRRLAFCSKSNLKIIDCYFSNILKHHVFGSQKLYGISSGTCTSTSRYFSAKLIMFDDTETDCENEHLNIVLKKYTKKENIQRLMSCLECSESEVISILKDVPQLKNLTTKDIKQKIQFFHQRGIELKEVIKNPWLLCTTAIESKFQMMNKLGVKNIHASIPLLGVSLKRLKEIAYWAENSTCTEKNRIAFISEKLQCDPSEISYVVSIHKFIERIPFDRLVTVLQLLLDAGVFPEDILRDIWVLRYSQAQVHSRVIRAKEGGIEHFKPWMVRCTEKIFINTLRRHSEKRALLGPHEDSAVKYISSRLGVNPAEAQLILIRHPQLRGVGAAKLCNTLDFLLGKEQREANSRMSDGDAIEENQAEGPAKFNRIQVWNSSRALCHSLETMKVRLARLRALGYEPWSPSILYKSRKKFEEFVKKLEEKAQQNQSDDSAPEAIEDSNKGTNAENRSSAH